MLVDPKKSDCYCEYWSNLREDLLTCFDRLDDCLCVSRYLDAETVEFALTASDLCRRSMLKVLNTLKTCNPQIEEEIQGATPEKNLNSPLCEKSLSRSASSIPGSSPGLKGAL